MVITMKILPKMLLVFVTIVLVFGLIITATSYLDSEREKNNLKYLYEERAVSIAKTLDSTIENSEQLNATAQSLVDRMMKEDIGVFEFSIHGKAPEGKTSSGYWRIASNDPTIVHLESDPEDLEAIKVDQYNVIYMVEDGKPIIDVTSPLHDSSGTTIATAGIKFDMSAIESHIQTTMMLIITIIMLIIAIIVTIIMANSITRPIMKLKDVADRVTSGDFDAELPESKSNDEIMELTASIEMLIVGLNLKKNQ
jgi:HAMP domain-containing protein